MPQGARRSGRGGGGGRGRNKDTSRRPASGRGATKARRTSSGGTGRCESEASVPPRPSEYRKFDSATSNVRGVMIGSLADELIRHQDSKGGRAQRGFVEGLVTRTNGVAPLLKITRDDINDEVKRRKKKKKKEAESARAAALSSSGDAATDSVASVGSRVRFAPDTASSRLIARGDARRSASRASTNCAAPRSAATTSIPPISSGINAGGRAGRPAPCRRVAAAATCRPIAAAAAASISPVPGSKPGAASALPNRCSYPDCGAPLSKVPGACRDCRVRLVHVSCAVSAQIDRGMNIDPSLELCSVCLDHKDEEEGDTDQDQSIPSGPVKSSEDGDDIVDRDTSAIAGSNQCKCLWTGRGVATVCSEALADECSVCKGPVTRLCQQSGEGALGWSSAGEMILFCPSCHPDNTKSSDSAAMATADSTGDGSNQKAYRDTNRGGRPKGSTEDKKRADRRKKKEIVNSIVRKYATLQQEAKEANSKTLFKRVRVPDGTLARLTAEAKKEFNYEGEISLSLTTISSRMKSGNLEVWHPGVHSPILVVEVLLTSMIYTAYSVMCPLSVSKCKELMNSMLEGTEHEAALIKWKKARNMYNPNAPLVGSKWWKGYCARNPHVCSQTGRKFAKNRAEAVLFDYFVKMYIQFDNAVIQSGNGKRFERPVHMDRNGRIVEDEKDGYGRPVQVDVFRPENVFVMDECGDNTHGKDDGNRAGEKKVVPRGAIPAEVVSTKNSHFSILPVSNLLAETVLVTVIFKGERLSPAWALGCDVFAEWVEGSEVVDNFGPGKRFPGLSLFDSNGKEIPVLFAATPSASMVGTILRDTFAALNRLGIARRGTDERGTFYPCAFIDGHPSRVDCDFLEYVNLAESRFCVVLGAPDATNYWQHHDSSEMNGGYKSELAQAKS